MLKAHCLTNLASLKEIINCYLYSTEDEEDDEYIAFQKEKTEFVQENIIDLLVNIALLKNSKTHATLGDFYLALAYIFTLLINDMSPEMNSAIGVEMMHIFDILGNPYAQNALTLPTDTNRDEYKFLKLLLTSHCVNDKLIYALYISVVIK